MFVFKCPECQAKHKLMKYTPQVKSWAPASLSHVVYLTLWIALILLRAL